MAMDRWGKGVAVAAAAMVAVADVAAQSPRVVTDRSGATPGIAMEELLATDRAFAAASAKVDLITGIAAMYAADVRVGLPGGKWAEGVAAATEALRANPDNATSKAEWAPIRGGLAADGQHGFTYGYMTVRKGDGTVLPVKYLAYWIKGPAGWRVIAYKRGRRPEGDVSLAMLPPALPASWRSPTTDEALLAAQRTGLVAAERAFSDDAQTIGIGPAFAKHGSADAANMGQGAAWLIGASEIGKDIGGTPPEPGSPVSWSADHAIVASSGDLGITFGTIRTNANPSAPGTAFFTIWRRESAKAPWRYIAE
jgi:hypothetical protein